MDAHQRDSYQFWIRAAQSQLSLLESEAGMINFTLDRLARDVRGGKLDHAAYDAECSKLSARYQEIVGEYSKGLQNLRTLSGDRVAFLQKTLQGLRDEHRALKETLDASGGHDAEASALMSQVYK